MNNDHEKDPVHTLHVMMRAWDMAVRADAQCLTPETTKQVEEVGKCALVMCQFLAAKNCAGMKMPDIANVVPLKPVK